ncbi:DUF2017 domain-containing protein [Propionibacterium freudenreichii]|uniref:Uncharacterized protein n=1 Tax=Propionibacterium freudenreichii TaxID=1744 RepID=A0A2C7AR23_9ACTN
MMHGFRRRRGQLTCTFEDTELTILCSLTKTLLQLLRSDAMPPVRARSWNDSSDCSPEALFAELENQMGCEVKADFATNPEVDPVLRRLFPDAYRDDEGASTEFRRFSQASERDEKLDAAVAMLSDMNQVGHDGRCAVPDEHVNDWLKTLTALRVAVAVRLGIKTSADADELGELPDEDPRTAVFSIYEWLGWVQESLLDCLH